MTEAGVGSSRKTKYHELSEALVPDSPLSPSQAKNATGTASPVGKSRSDRLSVAIDRRSNNVHWPPPNVASAVSACSPAGSATDVPMPRASASTAPAWSLCHCHW